MNTATIATDSYLKPSAAYGQIKWLILINSDHEYIQTTPILARYNFLRCLAVLQIQSKSSPVCRTIQMNGKQHYLWRAVNQEGELVNVYLQAKRDGAAAKRFLGAH